MKKLGLLLIPILALAFLGCPPKQDCVSFNNDNAEVKNVDGSWKIVDGSSWLLDFNDKESQARKALQIIKHYGMNHLCFVGRPDASMEYLLVNGQPPEGYCSGEDCTPFDLDKIEVKYTGGAWKIVEGDNWLMHFGDEQGEAWQSWRIIKYHKFTHICFVGRPDPHMTYFRR